MGQLNLETWHQGERKINQKMKISLPNITLMCIDCVNAGRALKVLEICQKEIDFGAVKLLTSIPIDHKDVVKIKPINSLNAYSVFMMSKCYEYIDTDFVLIVQRDGFIINPSCWNDDWLLYDYIGGLFIQYPKVGSGGFSIRSKKIMEEFSKTVPDWDWTQAGADKIQSDSIMYEDGMLSLSQFSKRFNIAPPEVACEFAQAGSREVEYLREKSFGFHRTWQSINFQTGIIDSSDTTKDLHVSYDHEIDLLK